MPQNPKGLYRVLFNFPFLPENGLSEIFVPYSFRFIDGFSKFCYFIMVFVILKVCYDNPAYYFINMCFWSTARVTCIFCYAAFFILSIFLFWIFYFLFFIWGL